MYSTFGQPLSISWQMRFDDFVENVLNLNDFLKSFERTWIPSQIRQRTLSSVRSQKFTWSPQCTFENKSTKTRSSAYVYSNAFSSVVKIIRETKDVPAKKVTCNNFCQSKSSTSKFVCIIFNNLEEVVVTKFCVRKMVSKWGNIKVPRNKIEK